MNDKHIDEILEHYLGTSNIQSYPKMHRASMKYGDLTLINRECILNHLLDEISFHAHQKEVIC